MSRPFLAGEVHGLRAWSLESPEGDFLLAGYFGVTWEPGGEPTVAECHAHHPWTVGEGHEAPAHDCSCGLYGLHPRPETAAGVFDGAPGAHGNGFGESLQIIGLVEAWGRVELHEDGFRAEYARPVLLTVAETVKGTDYEQLIASLAARYRTEVAWYEDPGEIFELCRERGYGLSKGTAGRLLAEQQGADDEDGLTGIGPGARAEDIPPAGRWEKLRDRALLALAAAFSLVLWGGGIALAVVIAIAIVNYEEPEHPVRVARPDPQLSAVREIVDRSRARPLYISVVRNESRSRAALGVRPVETAFGHIDRRTDLAPGGLGVVVDEPKDLPERRRGPISRGFTATMIRSDGPRVRVTASGFDRSRCLITARLDSSAPLAHLGLIVLAADRRGRFAGWARYTVGPVPAGDSAHVVDRVYPAPCLRLLDSVEVYPELGPGQLRVGSPGAQGPRDGGGPGVSGSAA